MSISSERGKDFEQLVAKMIRSKLAAKVMRDRRSGAGNNKSDISDYYGQIPLSIECKDQDTVKIKEWFTQADQASSFNQVPTVVFHADSEILATLRFSDLLNFLVEIADQKAEIDDLREPVRITTNVTSLPIQLGRKDSMEINVEHKNGERIIQIVGPGADRQYCKNGHIADDYGYCMQLSCKYSRGYRKPKAKKSGKRT